MKISACLVVYNEEKLIERCIESFKDYVDEIIVVHDGDCTDKTLEIAGRYTDKIFIRPHIGIAEPLRSYSYEVATCEWILQVDADEYFDPADAQQIRALVENEHSDAYIFKWELFDGDQAVAFPGLQKLCLFRKSKISNLGIPQVGVHVDGVVRNADVLLHHKPLYDNVSWSTANKKRNYWLESHVDYFFPELVKYECFNTTPVKWIDYTKKVRKYPWAYIIFYPMKNLLGQLKNGLWKTRLGINVAFQQYIYYLVLYYRIWKKSRSLKRN